MSKAKAVMTSLMVGFVCGCTANIPIAEPTTETPVQLETAPLWQSLSIPTEDIVGDQKGDISVNGVKLFYVQKGQGPDVVLLHGGLGRLDTWQKQFDMLTRDFRVTAIDSRAHGRSTRDDRPLNIHLMAEDISQALQGLNIESAAIVGWSDGGNIGLDLAIHHPEQVSKLVAFGANFSPEGALPSAGTNPLLGAYVSAMAKDYEGYSVTEEGFDAFSAEVFRMWAEEPNFTAAQLGSISAPTLVMHGRYEEAIKLEHAQDMAEFIPGGQLHVFENVSHFGMWQDPDGFNAVLLDFLK